MIRVPIPNDELVRITELERYEILDTLPEKEFEDLIEMAAEICQTPISLISLVDVERQWFKARIGLKQEQIPREFAFCSYAILGSDIFEIHDASEDERFKNNPLVQEDPNIRFYAGYPLVTSNQYKIGTLCVIDRKPRKLTDFQKSVLKTISEQIVRNLDLRLAIKQKEREKLNLEILNDNKNKLFSIISHDLRSPMIALRGLLYLFDEGLPMEEIKTLRETLDHSMETAINLLDNLLVWSKNRIEGVKDEKVRLDIYKVFEQKKELYEGVTAIKNIKIINQLATSLPVSVEENILRVILRNLINNAIKFSKEGGNIFLNAVDLDDKIRISIQDEGVGISEENIKSLFLFKNIKSKRGTKNETGAGLGLMLCKELLTEIGGDISAESTLGKGSTFSFTILK